jgi:hypothetical protein
MKNKEQFFRRARAAAEVVTAALCFRVVATLFLSETDSAPPISGLEVKNFSERKKSWALTEKQFFFLKPTFEDAGSVNGFSPKR